MLYGVIGRPVGHSKSPAIHAAFAAQTGEDVQYVAVPGTEAGFAADVAAFRARGGRGLNVTMPFKADAFAYATALSDAARRAGAVNCLSFDGEAAEGDNFDGTGLVRDIVENLRVPVAGRRVLLLGAGGAARGAVGPLLAAGPAELVVANRTPDRAAALLAAFPGPVRAASLQAPGTGFDIAVNATAASMDTAALPIPPGTLRPGGLAYDMVYGRGLTPFLRAARENGAGRVADGVGMLVEQAAESFHRWRGVRPDTAGVIRAVTVPLD